MSVLKSTSNIHPLRRFSTDTDVIDQFEKSGRELQRINHNVG